jgi:hypothetical protein
MQRPALAPALALAFSIAAVTPALAGPPWITVEVRPNGPGFVLFHTFHHGTPAAMALQGTAEGLVDGRRLSVPLRFERADADNAFAVPKNWPEGGVWVLNVASNGEHGGAGAVVGVDRTGAAAFVRFPRTVTGTSRAATHGEIEAMLRALDAGQQPPALGSTGWFAVLSRLGATLLVLGLGTAALLKGVTMVVGRLRAPRARAVLA